MNAGDQPTSPHQSDDQLALMRRGTNIRSYGVIKGIMASRVVDSLPLRVRCECALPLCEEIIEVTLSRRRELRRNYPRGFIVVPPHAGSPEATAVHETAEFCVVEIARFTDAVTDL